jgi:multidrug efflux system membrane fusion protein
LRTNPIRAVVLAAAALSVSCGGNNAAEVDPAAGPLAVSVQDARTETLRDVFVAAGVIVPAASTDWSVTVAEPARIAELPKAEGDAVATGDLLVRLEIPSVNDEIAAADVGVAEARTRAANANAEVAKLTPLFESGVVSRQMFDAAKATAAAATAALQTAEGKRDAAKAQADRGVIRARFPGIVIKRFHVEGEFVAGTPTDAILRVIDPNKVQVSAPVPMSRFSRILPGQSVTVQSGGGPPEPALVASRIAPQDAAATTAEIRLDFSTPTALTIDAPVQIEMTMEERKDAVVVASSAILRDANGAYVFVAGDDGLAHRREVRTGLAVGQLTQIVSGITPGEHVITTSLDQVTDGLRVTVR